MYHMPNDMSHIPIMIWENYTTHTQFLIKAPKEFLIHT